MAFMTFHSVHNHSTVDHSMNSVSRALNIIINNESFCNISTLGTSLSQNTTPCEEERTCHAALVFRIRFSIEIFNYDPVCSFISFDI